MALLEVHDLRTTFKTEDGVVAAVNGLSFSVEPGSTLGIVGESGSGKSVTSLSIMRLIAQNGRIERGTILFKGENLLEKSEAEMRRIRGRDIAMIFQDPMTSLNPVLTIGEQIAEATRLHLGLNKRQALDKAVDMLDLVRIPAPRKRLRDYPHQFSGGMRQRVMIAMALSCDPAVLIADEPTTALDVTIQAQIIELMNEMQARLGSAIILITHDLGVVAETCENVLVMYGGNMVEYGTAEQIFAAPKMPYTMGLLESLPRLDQAGTRLIPIDGQPPNLLRMPPGCAFAPRCRYRMPICDNPVPLYDFGDGHVARCYLYDERAEGQKPIPAENRRRSRAPPSRHGRRPRRDDRAGAQRQRRSRRRRRSASSSATSQVLSDHRRDSRSATSPTCRAVDGIDFEIRRGETLGLVGESGSGKTTAGRVILRLADATGGSVTFEGRELIGLSRAEMRPLRKEMQIIFQDPYASLNPRMTVGSIIREPLEIHGIAHGQGGRRARPGAAAARRACSRITRTATRTSSRAASASASASRARSRSTRSSSSPTSRCRRSTSRSRRRSSTCSKTCSSSSG